MEAIQNQQTRLKAGQIICLCQVGKCEVIEVNECRAIVRPTKKIAHEINPIFGDPVRFETNSRSFSISPNSECKIWEADPRRLIKSMKSKGENITK